MTWKSPSVSDELDLPRIPTSSFTVCQAPRSSNRPGVDQDILLRHPDLKLTLAFILHSTPLILT